VVEFLAAQIRAYPRALNLLRSHLQTGADFVIQMNRRTSLKSKQNIISEDVLLKIVLLNNASNM